MDTATAEHIVTNYLACWNTAERVPRRALIEETWTADARSVDPIAEVAGREAIDAMIAATQAQFPGHHFELRGAIAEHHDVVHWGWTLSSPSGDTVVSGFDVATIVDGRIGVLVGFFNS